MTGLILEVHQKVNQSGNVRPGPDRQAGFKGVVSYYAQDFVTFGKKRFFADFGPPYFDLFTGTVNIAFNQNDIAIFKKRRKPVEGIFPRCFGQINGHLAGGGNGHRHGPGLTVPKGVFAGFVQFVVMAAVLERADLQPATGYFLNQLNDQGGFTVLGTARDMNDMHKISVITRFESERTDVFGD